MSFETRGPLHRRGVRPRGKVACAGQPSTHHALDNAPEGAPLNVLGDEVEPLVLVEHPNELEHIGMLQAAHDLHLAGSKQAVPGAVHGSPPPSTVPPEARQCHRQGPSPPHGAPATPTATVLLVGAAPPSPGWPFLALLADTVSTLVV